VDILSERYEDAGLKGLHDAGRDVSWAGEVIRFREGAVEYRFDLDDSVPGEAVFAKITVDGRESGVKLGRPQGPDFRELPRTAPLLWQAVRHLRDQRGVQWVAVYDAEVGFYRRLDVAELAGAG
jgi:hypothetical protein